MNDAGVCVSAVHPTRLSGRSCVRQFKCAMLASVSTRFPYWLLLGCDEVEPQMDESKETKPVQIFQAHGSDFVLFSLLLFLRPRLLC